MSLNRREALRSLALAGGGALCAAAGASAIEPIRRNGRIALKLSLAAYGYRRELALNRQPPAMTLADFIDTAATMPLEAVELTSYYFPQTTPAFLAELKGRCTRLGLDISGTAVRNDFCTPSAERLRMDLAHVRDWVQHTSRLGGKTIRIFAGTVARGDTEEQGRARCVAAIEEICEYAGQYGIFIALENHGGITATPERMLPIVQAVRSPWFGVNLDTGNFHTADPYADLARLAPYAVNVQIKTEIQRQGQRKEAADLARLLQILRDVNYRGYAALEHEADEDPRETIPGHVARLRQLVDRGAAASDRRDR